MPKRGGVAGTKQSKKYMTFLTRILMHNAGFVIKSTEVTRSNQF